MDLDYQILIRQEPNKKLKWEFFLYNDAQNEKKGKFLENVILSAMDFMKKIQALERGYFSNVKKGDINND